MGGKWAAATLLVAAFTTLNTPALASPVAVPAGAPGAPKQDTQVTATAGDTETALEVPKNALEEAKTTLGEQRNDLEEPVGFLGLQNPFRDPSLTVMDMFDEPVTENPFDGPGGILGGVAYFLHRAQMMMQALYTDELLPDHRWMRWLHSIEEFVADVQRTSLGEVLFEMMTRKQTVSHLDSSQTGR